MSLATPTTAKAACNLPNIPDALWTEHLPAAEQRVRGLIGDSLYNSISAAEAPWQTADQTALKQAEGLLCGSIVLRLSAWATSGQGVVRGFGGGQGGAKESLTFSEVRGMADTLRSLAEDVLARYRRQYLDDLRTTGDDQPHRFRFGINAAAPPEAP